MTKILLKKGCNWNFGNASRVQCLGGTVMSLSLSDLDGVGIDCTGGACTVPR